MHDPLQRLYRTKLVLLATLLLFAGLALLLFGHWAQHLANWRWLTNWPILDIGSGLFTTGLLGVALQYFDGQDSEVRAAQRLERVLTAAAPAMRDAVIHGFAFQPEDLARVATPETLDQIVTNGLAIRLGDADFAADVYRELKQQAIDVPERLYDARISIRLSMDRGTATGRAPLLVTTVQWEFSVTPTYPTRRFVCLSDLDEFREIDNDAAATSAWYIKPRPGIDAGARETFELVDFTVDGHSRPIRRTARQGSQTYSVGIGKQHIDDGRMVAITYTYRTIPNTEGRLIQLRIDQPTKGVSIELDYSDTHIPSVRALDFIAGSKAARVSHSPDSIPGKNITVEFEGWVFPRSGVAFLWTSADGVVQSTSPSRASAPSP